MFNPDAITAVAAVAGVALTVITNVLVSSRFAQSRNDALRDEVHSGLARIEAKLEAVNRGLVDLRSETQRNWNDHNAIRNQVVSNSTHHAHMENIRDRCQRLEHIVNGKHG